MTRSLALCLLLSACPTPDDQPTGWPEVDASDRANPMVPEIALLPWPSDQYLVADPSTATGRRLSVPAELLPVGLTPEMFNRDDGFTRIPQIVTALPGGVDPSSLPDATDWEATLNPATSSVLLLRADTHELVPALVERDASQPDVQRASLLIRPHRLLAENTRYIVLLRTTLRAADGSALSPNAAWRTLRDGKDSSDPAIASWRPRVPALLAAAEAVGWSSEEILQAWSFTTRSEAQLLQQAVASQDAVATAPLGEVTLEPVVYEADRALLRGTIEVPWFLDETSRMVIDASGAAVPQGTFEAPFLVTIPASVRETRPTMLFGHGFFSSMEEPTWGNLFGGLERWQMPAITTRFIGFDDESLVDATRIITRDLHDLEAIIDQQLQSHTHFTLIHRLFTERLADELTVDFGDGPFKPLSPTELHYMGISNGGTQGVVLMTTSPVLRRGALIVPGSGWSHMLQRASQWSTLGSLLAIRYDDPRDLQLVTSLFQQVFDPLDGMNFTDHLLRDRLPGRETQPDVLLVEAIWDAQVANLVTRWVSGNAGFPLVTPAPAEVWGVQTITAEPPEGATARSAHVQFDLGAEPLPAGNVAPIENDVHNDVRLLEGYYEQVGAFLLEGRIVHPCDGPCDPD